MRIAAALVTLLLVLTSCSDSSSSSSGREAPELNRGTVLVDTDEGTRLMYVLIAESEEQRAEAFLRTTTLPEDEGLVFLYFEPTDDAFVAEGRFPLSVAFFDAEGEIVETADLGRCDSRGDCPSYAPSEAYLGALGVNEGVLEDLGVSRGDSVQVVPGSE